MGVFLSVDESHQILCIRFEGVVTDEVFLSRYEQVREWHAVHGHYSHISDFSEVVSYRVTPQGIRQLAIRPPLVPNDRLRIVVAPQDLAFGMARMFEIVGGKTRNTVHVVRSMQDAYQLLGVESLELKPMVEW
jgi:hypothetical protein